MHRRLACLAVALLVSGCSFTGFGSPPNYGYVVITAGGVGLRSGAADVPPNLDLRLHATGAPLQASDVTATLDGNSLKLATQHQDLLATVQPLLPLSSPHRLSVAVSGMSTQNFTFTVIPPTAAMLAAHIDPASGLVVDAVFDDAPSQPAMAAALPGATVTWSDPTTRGSSGKDDRPRRSPCRRPSPPPGRRISIPGSPSRWSVSLGTPSAG